MARLEMILLSYLTSSSRMASGLMRPLSSALRMSSTAIQKPLHAEWIDKSSDESTIVFLHGLLGTGRNLRTFAKEFCQQSSSNCVLVDLPGHGKSNSCQVDSLESSIPYLEQSLEGITDNWTLVGHSMGGRLALQYCASPTVQRLPQRLILLDTVPAGPNASVERVLQTAAERKEAWATSDLTRKAMIDDLETYGMDAGTAQWLASSWNEEANDFIFDLEVAFALLEDVDSQFPEDFLKHKRLAMERIPRIDLVRAGKNVAWKHGDSMLTELEECAKQSPDAFQIHLLPDASHWVHVDDLEGLLKVLD